MRDLQDWHKQLDLAAKQAKRARELAGRSAAPALPDSARPERPNGSTVVNRMDVAEVKAAAAAPPRKGRGPRKLESREELLARLLDPTLTLEETSRLLEVCPTTVRRWTNKGVLPCERSAGNQRRFKLSSIEAFLRARNQVSPMLGED